MTNNLIEKENIISVFFIEIIRIWDVSYWFAMSFLGFLLGVSFISLNKYLFLLVVFVVSTFFMNSFTFTINNYYDVDSDRKNPRRRLINGFASGKISKKTGRLLLLMFFVVPLFVSSLLGDIKIILFCFLLLFMGWIYSAPPLRIKNRPIIDVIWHFFEFFFLVLWGSLLAGSMQNIVWFVAISAGIFSCVFQVYNHIFDYSYDKETGTTTFAVWAGLNNATKTAKILIVVHILIILSILLFYSLRYVGSILIILIGIGIGLYTSKPKTITDSSKWSLISFLFYFTISVYISCLFYRIFFDFNLYPLNFLAFGI